MKPYPEEARENVKLFCDMSNVLISRQAFDKGLFFDVTDADIKYADKSDEFLEKEIDKVFKKLFIQYAN